jgi:hypothetical protein
MHIIEKKKIKIYSFHLEKISIKYEISKFTFLECLKWSIWEIECNVKYYHKKRGDLMVRVFAFIIKVKGSNLTNGAFVINNSKLIKYFPM